MIFHFRLRDIDAIAPWGSPAHPTLSWFGLSDGWYWLTLDGQELFRVCGDSAEAPAPTPPEPPYVDYPVVRLWEDVLDLLPTVLQPLPPDIAHALHDPDRFMRAIEIAEERALADEDADPEPLFAGLAFWHGRRLDTGHLVGAPRLWLWRDGDDMHALWRSRPPKPGADPLWHPVHGHTVLPVENFVGEVRAFDESFIAAMGQRVTTVLAAGGRRGVEIDLDQLLREQSDRATWLQRALDRVGTVDAEAGDWTAARRLLATLPAPVTSPR